MLGEVSADPTEYSRRVLHLWHDMRVVAFAKAFYVAVNEAIAFSIQLIEFDFPLRRESRKLHEVGTMRQKTVIKIDEADEPLKLFLCLVEKSLELLAPSQIRGNSLLGNMVSKKI